jgi:NhaP-type Na+/H+ or K+/H+ antiporter
VLTSGSGAVAHGLVDAPTRLLVGLATGLVGGGLIALALRVRGLVPDEHRNVLTLAMTLVVYQVANAIVEESGIMAAVAAGVVVGNSKCRVASELKAFKEQLTVMLIGLLFVLLAADVRVADVTALGSRGLLVVAALVFIVRPLNILACTWGTDLKWKRRVFLAWVAPRGIVAAAVASLFATRLDAIGNGTGSDLRALVFLVIAVTVVFQGATAELLARLLGVRRPRNNGYVILGAKPLGRLLGSLLKDNGHDVVLIDANATLCSQAEADGLRVIYGNAMDESVQMRAALDSRRAVIGALHNEAVNLRFAQKSMKEAGAPKSLVVGERNSQAVELRDLQASDVGLLFGFEIDPEVWSVRVQRNSAKVQVRRREEGETCSLRPDGELVRGVLPMLLASGGQLPHPVDEKTKCSKGDRVWWLVSHEHASDVETWLDEQGWRAIDPE